MQKNPKKTKAKKNIATLTPSVPQRTTKEDRLFQNLDRTTRQFIQGKSFVAMTEAELFERLSLSPQHDQMFHEILQKLLLEGFVEISHTRYTLKQVRVGVVRGVLRVHPRGFGFLQADDPVSYPEDIFVPKQMTQNAVDGDIVEVQVSEIVSEKGPEGKVVTIVSRGRTHIAGIIRAVEKDGDLVAYVPLLGLQQRVIVQPTAEYTLRVGDRIVMEVLDWGTKETETVCKVSDYIGHISDPSCDIKAAIMEFELPSEFPLRCLEEAEKVGNRVSLKDIATREDLRELETFTIDPKTAKDFDDAISLTRDKKGHFHLSVHIADVSHYVPLGSALDKEARLRCNSTYFPGFCLPMLPPELSNNLCSLRPLVNRLTASVIMHFDQEGTLVDYRMVRSVIKSAKRFTYQEAKEVLDGKKKSPHLPTLNLMVELCKLLKRKRYERGSIEFCLPELVVKVDEKGTPIGTEYVEYDVTHQLVEEFMLKTNEIVALHLTNKGKNLTYRVHDIPAEENMKDFSTLAAAFGFRLSDNPTPLELQKLFDEAVNTPYGPYLATSYIRRMRLAMYSADNIGHYGLGLTHYCHFTSPIRRYVDLVVHRILFGESDDRDSLEMIATKSSEQERISSKAENSVVLLKKLRLLNSTHEKEPYKRYEAVVTRVKNFGLFFEALEFMVEGFLHVSELENDYYIFEEAAMRLRGRHSGKTYSAGDRVVVMLRSVDFIILESKWYFAGEIEDNRKTKSRHKPKSKTHKKQIEKSEKDLNEIDLKPTKKLVDRQPLERKPLERSPLERKPFAPIRAGKLPKKEVEQKLLAPKKGKAKPKKETAKKTAKAKKAPRKKKASH